MQFPIFQVDAFANAVFSGNPAAVVLLNDAWLPDATMQAIAAENNLSETAFLLPDQQPIPLRWFTPAIEVDLCGHATLATAHILFEHQNHPADQPLVFTSRSGLLEVRRIEKGRYQMDFPADHLERVATIPQPIIEGLNCPVLEVWKGREDYLVRTDAETSVQQLQPNFRVLAELGSRGVLATAPGGQFDFVSRCFFPNAGIDEDPVTGSAHTTLTPYWAGQLGKTSMNAAQISPRGGQMTCTLLDDRVLLEGSAVTYLEGKIIQ